MTLLSTALITIPLLSGISLVIVLNIFKEKITAFAVGSISGLAFSATLLYGLSLLTTITSALLWIILFAAGASSAWLLWRSRSWWHTSHTNRTTLVITILSLAFSLLLSPKLIFMENGALATSIANAWGDLGWHIANITAFAAGQTVPPQNPIFAGTRLTYPFLTNFYSGVLLRSGASLSESITVPTILLVWLCLILVYIFTLHTSRSRIAAITALILFIGSGATLGGLRLIDDLSANQNSLFYFFTHLPRDYSGNGADPNGYHFINIFIAGLLPQRALLLGLPLALALLLTIQKAVRRHRPGLFLFAGLLAGTIPLAHAHTVLALIPAVLSFMALHLLRTPRTKKNMLSALSLWLIFSLAAFSVGLPAITYYLSESTASNSTFFKFDPGWTLTPSQNPAWFWFQNTGLILPLTLLALLHKKMPAAIRACGLASLAVWLMANLFVFAPWAWDNYKLLVYWLVLSLPVLGWLAAYAMRHPYRLMLLPITALLILIHSYTGMLDITRVMLPTIPSWPDWSADDITFAEEVKQVTNPRDVILTAPYHNHPIALAGRAVYLGYSAHVWSHGGDPNPRSAAIPSYYEGSLAALPETSVQYIAVGPVERSRYASLVIRPDWQLVIDTGPHQLYRVTP